MKIIFLIVISCFTSSILAQPSNDDCEKAIEFPAEGWCSEVRAFTIFNATPSLTTGQTCSGEDNSSMKDVWFKFTVPGNFVFFGVTALEVPLANIPLLFTITLYTGKCQELVLDRCIEGDSDVHWIVGEDFVPGQTYLARIATSIDSLKPDSGLDSLGNFGLCLDSYNTLECDSLFLVVSNDTLIEFGSKVRLLATAITDITPVHYQWFVGDSMICDNCPSVEVFPESNTTYVVFASNDQCFAQSEVEVNVLVNNVDREVFIPNAFTPNGDQINDRITIFGSHSLSSVRQLDIYNRWGELVFREQNLNPNDEGHGWDGNQGGDQAPGGIYAYVATIEFIDGEIKEYSGNFHLIR